MGRPAGEVDPAKPASTPLTVVIDEALAQSAADIVAKPVCTGVPASVSKEDVWLSPKLVCEVRYLEWTDAGNLRHPVFLGFRPDKPVRECVSDDTDAEPVSTAAYT